MKKKLDNCNTKMPKQRGFKTRKAVSASNHCVTIGPRGGNTVQEAAVVRVERFPLTPNTPSYHIDAKSDWILKTITKRRLK